MRKRTISMDDLSEDIVSLLNKINYYDDKIESILNGLKNLIEFESSLDEIVSSMNNFVDSESLDQIVNSLKKSVELRIESTVKSLAELIPKKLSDLENDCEFITAEDKSITSKAPIDSPDFKGKVTIGKAEVATKNSIPQNVSQLLNDAKYITAEDFSIKKRALKPEAGYNESINNISPYPFTVEGSNKKAAGITFDRGKYRINFGLDKDNKLKIGGGTLEDKSFEIVDSENILQTLFDKGLYILKIEDNKLIIMNDKDPFIIDAEIIGRE